MANIRKRAGNWQATVSVDGLRQSKTFTKKSEAQIWAKQIERKLTSDSKVQVITHCMADAMQKYLDDVVPTFNDPQKNRSYIKFLMTFDWMSIPLGVLSTDHLNRWRDLRYEDCSAKTVHTNFTLFKTALRYSGDHDYLELFESIKLKRVTGRFVPRLEKRDEEWLLHHAKLSTAKYLAPMINFALTTGMRRGEMLKLEWSMVDFERSWINLSADITKTGKPRRIPITEGCKAALIEIKELREAGNAVFRMNPFFKQGEGLRRVWPVTADSLRKTFETARSNAGLNDLHWHDLRHEALSRFFDLGLTVPEVQSISGHTTPDELSRYSHESGVNIHQKLGVSHD